MENNLFKKFTQKKWIILLACIIIAIAVIVAIFLLSDKDSDKDTPTDKNTTEATDNDSTDSSGSAVDTDTVTIETGTLSIEDAPEPTLNPYVANDVIVDTDPEPEVELKEHQKTFNDCMEAQDYEGAKSVLDSFFATNQYSITGDNTYDNYVYYYEKQDLYKESAMYQIDFLEREMGLDNIVEGNTKYQKLLETLKYVKIDDPRLKQIEASVNRWKEIDELLNAGQIDTAIEKLRGYIENGLQDCVYAFSYLGKAYGAKPDYYKQTRTYYIFLSKLAQREANTLEESFKVIFYEHGYVLANDYLTTDERDLIEDTTTADSMP